MGYIIHAFHPRLPLSTSEAELSGMYRSILHGQCALLLLDNAAGRAQIQPLVPPLPCALLVASRIRLTLPGDFVN